ncbi:hypothetical protein ABEW32_25750 [Paenibacillus jamilae]
MQGRLLSFDYKDRNGLKTNRLVEPCQLHYKRLDDITNRN